MVRFPESLAIDERFMVECEYTLFSLPPTKEKKGRGNVLLH